MRRRDMSSKIDKLCKKCKEVTEHRLTLDKRKKNPKYYACTLCSEENSKRHRKKHWLRYLAQKANARKKLDSEKITESMLKKLFYAQGKCCALSGTPFNMEEELYRPSLDRIDSSKGYREDNIQLVLYIVNKMKRELSEKLFMETCFNIADWYKLQYRPHLFKNMT